MPFWQLWMLMMTRTMGFLPLLTSIWKKTIWQLEEISGKSNNNRAAAMEQLESIRDQHILHTFLQDSEELHVWNLERNVLVQETHIDQQEPSTACGPNTRPSNQKFKITKRGRTRFGSLVKVYSKLNQKWVNWFPQNWTSWSPIWQIWRWHSRKGWKIIWCQESRSLWSVL